jgi:hypothetical protein
MRSLSYWRRLACALGAAALLAALAGCGRVETAAGPLAPASQDPSAVPGQPSATPFPTVVVVGEAPEAVPTVAVEAADAPPVPPSPELGPAPASGAQFVADFASGGLSAWRFADVHDNPAGAPPWVVREGRLAVPYNVLAGEVGDDLLAITGPAEGPDYRFEATALARASSIVGVVAGYRDPGNFVALLLADESSPNARGLQLVQRVGGVSTVLASAPDLLQANRWYTLAIEVKGTTVSATLDDAPALSATAGAPLGSEVGLYGGQEGGAIFGSARLSLR